ncbi:PREDICTED: uncharacterized protein LOC104721965 isoform X2 [Camelina sativa]|uniref:Uncharacterized protein LOC104721965 isoform X2 n=1 Tax=Camelina sativa TaxID=90675 RepID=A0ABM1QLZ1_CAMSA|nr:PREDICTED: uncharacterized protein LOC104721965 isoform X2 [Camelina sativa]
MKHLPIHLPREAELRGPVQYKWMYPFERFMFHLKKKVKILSRVEGSIIAQSINEERSNFAGHYFPPSVQTKSRKPSRYDDGGEKPQYITQVPDIFSQIGRLSGKPTKRWLTEEEVKHLHTYILLNCEELWPYERIYIEQLRTSYPHIDEETIATMKQNEFQQWMKLYVIKCNSRGERLHTWLEELVDGPLSLAHSSPTYYTRGYAFKVYRERENMTTINSGISTQAGNTIYYGVLNEILEVEFPRVINLKCIIFMCDWYDPSIGRGVRFDKFGVTAVRTSRRLDKYDPFFLTSQGEQVCYIPYPHINKKKDLWIIVTQISPRGRVHSVIENGPLQQTYVGDIGSVELTHDETIPGELEKEITIDNVLDVSEEELGEFEEEPDSALSEYSSDSE